MVSAGHKLREIRERWKMSLRDVEERSHGIAREWGNPSYRISASWLYRVEVENRKLAGAKLVVLAIIYSLTSEQMLALFHPEDSQRLQWLPLAVPNATLLLTHGPLAEHAQFWLPDEFMVKPPPEKTTLVPFGGRALPNRYRRGIIGLKDETLDPMITPGASVLIDTTEHSVAGARDWTNDFNRPIYFLVTREGYYCGYCELDRDKEWLTLVPYTLSYARTERWKYRKEIEVIGRVVAVNMRLSTLPPR